MTSFLNVNMKLSFQLYVLDFFKIYLLVPLKWGATGQCIPGNFRLSTIYATYFSRVFISRAERFGNAKTMQDLFKIMFNVHVLLQFYRTIV